MALKSDLFSALKVRLFGALGLEVGEKKVSKKDKEFVLRMLKGMQEQVDHEKNMINARGKEAVSVRLVPQVPVRDTEASAGWIGGGACLPAGTKWPEIEHPAQLLAQIECSQLPADLWEGLGPRHGWLAIFTDPMSFKAMALHFSAAEDFIPSPPVPKDCCIVGLDGADRAQSSGYRWRFPRWSVDIVPVRNGHGDPRVKGRCKTLQDRQNHRHDFIEDSWLPFDWSTTQMMVDTALSAYAKMGTGNLPQHLTSEAIANSEQAMLETKTNGQDQEEISHLYINHAEKVAMAKTITYRCENGPGVIAKLKTIKKEIERRAECEAFSIPSIMPLIKDMQELSWMHHRIPPLYRDGKKLSHSQRWAEGVQTFVLPITTHDPSIVTSWVGLYEAKLIEAAKISYLERDGKLPIALTADFEEVWGVKARHEMGGMGHIPWGYVYEYDESEDVTLLELPSSQLIGWMFGDVYSLVITIKKTDLSKGDFSKLCVQVTN